MGAASKGRRRVIQIPQTGVIKKQRFHINKDVSIIYGYNNCGKTTILKALDEAFRNSLMEQFILGQTGKVAIYIPTNRIIVSGNNTEEIQLRDYEEWIHYQKDSYGDYSLHLKRLRDQLLTNKAVHNFVCRTVCKIFEMDVKALSGRYSDGIENIINIYLNIIWAMIWDEDLSTLTEAAFYKLLSQKQIYVLIDEIEMFLHVNIQSKLIGCMKEDFAGSSFILTTHSPLLLTRYRQNFIYEIKDGRLEKIEEDVYYEDLDNIYEQFFNVEEIPAQMRDGINYLGDVLLHGQVDDAEKMNTVIEKLRNEYPNLYRRYNRIITKVQHIGEHHDKN